MPLRGKPASDRFTGIRGVRAVGDTIPGEAAGDT